MEYIVYVFSLGFCSRTKVSSKRDQQNFSFSKESKLCLLRNVLGLHFRFLQRRDRKVVFFVLLSKPAQLKNYSPGTDQPGHGRREQRKAAETAPETDK
jgi:hypothetical protein